MKPREQIEIETRNAHDRVIRVPLIGHHERGDRIPDVRKVIIARMDGFEEQRRRGKERDVLNVGVVFGVISNEVVHVMARFPPAHGQAAAKVGDEEGDYGVSFEMVGNAGVACIMRGEHDLLLV